MRNIYILINILILLFITSCTKKTEQRKSYLITGNIKNIPDSTYVYLNNINNNSKIIDSTYVTKSTFKLKFHNVEKEGDLFFITFENEKEKFKVNIFLEEKSYEIKGNYFHKDKIIVLNDSSNILLKEYRSIPKKFENKINKLFSSNKSEDERNNILESYLDSLKQEQRELLLKNPNNFFSLVELFRFKTTLTKKELLNYYNTLNERYKQNSYGVLLKNYISSNQIKIGNQFIDFVAKDNFNKVKKLSNFNDKIIILDFWAYWCKWCHVQNEKEFSYLNEKYKDDINIISYSLDEKIDVWRKSISKTTFKWINLSNLKGINDPIAFTYGVSNLPHTFIINKKGIIQKEFIGYKRDSLIEKEIKKILKQ